MSITKIGRPTMCSVDLANRIAEHIDDDCTIEIAAELEGVHRRRVYDWLTKGLADNAEEPYASFAHTITRARAQAAKRVIKDIRTAHYVTKDGNAYPDVRAQMWVAERVYGFEKREHVSASVQTNAGDDGEDTPEAIEAAVTVLKLARGTG